VEQPIGFYLTLMKVLIASSGSSSTSAPYNYREFLSPDSQIHQLAIFTPDALKYVVMVEVRMNEGKYDIYLVFKDGKKHEQQQQQNVIPPTGEFGEALYALVERVVNACCYTTWTSLI